ncbi:MAG: hypothetical protein KBF82_02810 [Chitinophagaceae bacterium]|nr:hypothetical protein [Chitinophagaceae bacterium]MBP9102770.1 hypothetical protein [Chitinophagaceae bacterium]
MKKILITVLAIVAIHFTPFAQGGGGQRQMQTPEQQAAKIVHVLDSAFKLTPANAGKLDTALTVLYKAQNDRMKEIMAGGERPDRETMMAESKKYTDARDEMIKLMITAEQFKIWKETIEPSMRPQRQGGAGGGGNRQN